MKVKVDTRNSTYLFDVDGETVVKVANNGNDLGYTVVGEKVGGTIASDIKVGYPMIFTVDNGTQDPFELRSSPVQAIEVLP
jgi:hypothetical protein